MTILPPSGAPFPYVGGEGVDPSADPSDPWLRTLSERMLEERLVFLSEFLDDQVAGRVAMELMTLDASGDEPVRLHIDCKGATLESAFALMDVIDALGVEVEAMCVGQVIGVSVGVLAVSHVRRATEHSRLRLMDPRFELTGRPSEVEAAVAHQRNQLRSFHERLAEATGQRPEKIEDDMRRGRFLRAHDAIEYGLVDELVRAEARVLQFPRQFGFRRG